MQLENLVIFKLFVLLYLEEKYKIGSGVSHLTELDKVQGLPRF